VVDAAALTGPAAPDAACPFCTLRARPHIMREYADFYVMADVAPLVEGHTLIIARPHLRCLGVMPRELDEQFLAIKGQVGRFLRRTYGVEPVFWEHGIFGQSVPHLHLHCIPLPLPRTVPQVGLPVAGAPTDLHAVRTWFAGRGHYWYAEQDGRGYLCPPDPDAYRAANAEFDALMDVPDDARPFWEHREMLQRRGDLLVRRLLVKWFDDMGF
jgi:diadenosine tetraphosphate (Ap4A) HIT family hydrolase